MRDPSGIRGSRLAELGLLFQNGHAAPRCCSSVLLIGAGDQCCSSVLMIGVGGLCYSSAAAVGAAGRIPLVR
jgi:hypothetical protein